MTDGGFDMEYKVDGRFLKTDLIKEKVTTYYDDAGKLVSYKFLYPQYIYPGGGYFASINDMANWAIGLDKNTLFPLILQMNWYTAVINQEIKPLNSQK